MPQTVVDDIYQTILKIRSEHTNDRGSAEQQWIQEHLNDAVLQKIAAKLSIVSFHILSALEEGEATGIELAAKLGVTRGGVSRAAKKLAEYHLISAFKHNDDRKKIFYSLTASGQKIAHVHDEIHQSVKKQLVKQLTEKYSEEELKIVADFLDAFHQMENKLN